MSEDNNVVGSPDRFRERGRAQKSNGGNGGGSDIVSFRLRELERRVGGLEEDARQTREICIRIEEKIESLATKSSVNWYLVATILLALLSILGHLMIRTLAG